MKFNPFLGRLTRGKKPSLHTNAMAEVATDQARLSSAESFAQRRQVDSTRQHVGKYAESKVVVGYQTVVRAAVSSRGATTQPVISGANTAAEPQSNRQLAKSSKIAPKIDIVRPVGNMRQAYNASSRMVAAPQRHTFREPPSRYR